MLVLMLNDNADAEANTDVVANAANAGQSMTVPVSEMSRFLLSSDVDVETQR